MNLAHVVQHIRDTSKQFGAGAALYDVEYRGVKHIVPVQVLRGMTVGLADIEPMLLDAGDFRARFCSRDDLLNAVQDPEIAAEMSADFIERTLERGDECHGIFEGNKLVSFEWYSNQPTSIGDELVLHFDPAWTYAYKAYTLRDYRGMRLNGTGMSLATRSFTRRGSRGLVLYVEANNYPSLHSMDHMGCRIFGNVYIARAFGRVVTWATPGCKPYGFHVEWTGERNQAVA